METIGVKPEKVFDEVQKMSAWKKTIPKASNIKRSTTNNDDLSTSIYDVVKNRTIKAGSLMTNQDVLNWCESPSAQLYMENILRQNIKSERHQQLCDLYTSGGLEDKLRDKSPLVEPAYFLGEKGDTSKKIWDIAAGTFDSVCPSPESSIASVNAQLKYFRAKYVEIVMIPEVMVKYFEGKNSWNTQKAWEFYHQCNSTSKTEHLNVKGSDASENVGQKEGIDELKLEKSTANDKKQAAEPANSTHTQNETSSVNPSNSKKELSAIKQLPLQSVKETVLMTWDRNMKTYKPGKINKLSPEQEMIKENNTAKDTLISESKSDKHESLKVNPAKYDVEAILDSRLVDGKKEYLVKLKDADVQKAVWESADNLNCPKLLNLFDSKMVKKRKIDENGAPVIAQKKVKKENINQKKPETLKIKDISQLKSDVTENTSKDVIDTNQKNAKDILIKKEQLANVFRSSNIVGWFSSLELRSHLEIIVKEKFRSERHAIVLTAFASKKFDESFESKINPHLRTNFLELANRQSACYEEDLAAKIEGMVAKMFEAIFPPKPSETNNSLVKKFRSIYIKYVLVPEGIVRYLQKSYNWSNTIAEQFYRKFPF